MASKRRTLFDDEIKIVGINHGLCLTSNLFSEGWKHESFADVKFYCRDTPTESDTCTDRKKVLRANRSVLAASSPFFASLLPDCELESDICISTELQYDDMFAVLEYIYCGRLLCSMDSKAHLLSTLKEFQVFVPEQEKEDTSKEQEVEEIELIIEDDEPVDRVGSSAADGISDSESVHIDLEFEEGKEDLIFEPCDDATHQYVLQAQIRDPPTSSPSYPKVYLNTRHDFTTTGISPSSVLSVNQLDESGALKVFPVFCQSVASHQPTTVSDVVHATTRDDHLLSLPPTDKEVVTLCVPSQFFGVTSSTSVLAGLEKQQVKRAVIQSSCPASPYPLSLYHTLTWCLGVYSPFEPDIRVPEMIPYDDPLVQSKVQPIIHGWTSFRQPTFLGARPKHVYRRLEASAQRTRSNHNKAVLKLADIRSMTTHKGKIHVTLNGEPVTQTALPQLFNDSERHRPAQLHGPNRPEAGAVFTSDVAVDENDDTDKIDLALARHFLQEEVRNRQRLQLKSKMFSERVAQYKEIARSILLKKRSLVRKNAENASALKSHPSSKKSGPQTQCEQCGKMVLASRLKVHLKIHSGIKSHLCDLCGRAFLLKAYLNAHIRINHRQRDRPKRFICASCGYTCDQKHKLEVHERTHTDERPFGCQYCDKRFREKGTLVRHVRTHTGEKPYACNICGTSYAARDTYVQHYKRKHEPKTSEPKECRPRAKHSNVVMYRCEFCQKGFFRVLAYEKHRATHTGVAAAVRCPQPGCDFTYSEMGAFKDHMASCHPDKTYTCGVCSKVFLTKQNLSNHQSKHDPNLGFHCSYCSLSLTTKASLVAHERIHTREKPYECIICGMRFHSPYLIKIHLRKHQPNHPKRKRSRRSTEEEQLGASAHVYC